MSQALQLELLRIRPFGGIPSYARRIAQIEALLSNDVAVSKADFTATNARQDQEIEDLERGHFGRGWKTYFVGGPLASGNNNGLSANAPFLNPLHLADNINLSEPNNVIFLGDVNINELSAFPNGNCNLRFSSLGANRYNINVKKDGEFYFGGLTSLEFRNIGIVSEREGTRSCFRLALGGSIHLSNVHWSLSDRARDFSISTIFGITPFTNVSGGGIVGESGHEDRLFTEFSLPFSGRRAALQGA